MKSFIHLFRLAFVLSGLFLLPSCTPLSEEEAEYLARRKEESEFETSFGESLQTGMERTSAINKVKEWGKEGETINQEQWARYRMGDEDGTIVYSRWDARKRSGDRYEVQFLYTVLPPGEDPVKKGFVWTVDNVIDQVTGPRPMNLNELGSRTEARSKNFQKERRLQHTNKTLE